MLIFPVPVLTKLDPCHQCFLLFNFPLKTERDVFGKQFTVKKTTETFNQAFQAFCQAKTHGLITFSCFIKYIAKKNNS